MLRKDGEATPAPAGPSVLGKAAPGHPPQAWELGGPPLWASFPHLDMRDPEGGERSRF